MEKPRAPALRVRRGEAETVRRVLVEEGRLRTDLKPRRDGDTVVFPATLLRRGRSAAAPRPLRPPPARLRRAGAPAACGRLRAAKASTESERGGRP